MKISVSTYSFGPYRDRGMDFMIYKAAEMGFDGVEYCFEREHTDAELASFRRAAEAAGLAPVCLDVGADLLSGCGGDLDREVDRLKREIDRAALLGVPMMRHDVSAGRDGNGDPVDFDAALPRLVEGCLRVTEYGETAGVRTLTENHGYYYQDAARVVRLQEAARHRNFGALVDIGNFMCADENPPEAVAATAKYAVHVHAKDFYLTPGDSPAPDGAWFPTRGGDRLMGTVIGQGDAGTDRSLAALAGSGYDGFVTVEFEGPEDALEGIRLGREYLTNKLEQIRRGGSKKG